MRLEIFLKLIWLESSMCFWSRHCVVHYNMLIMWWAILSNVNNGFLVPVVINVYLFCGQMRHCGFHSVWVYACMFIYYMTGNTRFVQCSQPLYTLEGLISCCCNGHNSWQLLMEWLNRCVYCSSSEVAEYKLARLVNHKLKSNSFTSAHLRS